MGSVLFLFEEGHFSVSSSARLWEFGQHPESHTIPTNPHSFLQLPYSWQSRYQRGRRQLHVAESIGSPVFAKDFIGFEKGEGN